VVAVVVCQAPMVLMVLMVAQVVALELMIIIQEVAGQGLKVLTGEMLVWAISVLAAVVAVVQVQSVNQEHQAKTQVVLVVLDFHLQ
jgi:hypothetical protein